MMLWDWHVARAAPLDVVRHISQLKDGRESYDKRSGSMLVYLSIYLCLRLKVDQLR